MNTYSRYFDELDIYFKNKLEFNTIHMELNIYTLIEEK